MADHLKVNLPEHLKEELTDLDMHLDRLVMPSPLPILSLLPGAVWPKIVYVTTEGKVYHVEKSTGLHGDVWGNWVEVRPHLLERIRRWLTRR